MRHNLVILVDVRRPEVDEDVDDKHDVHDEVDDGERLLVVGTGHGGGVFGGVGAGAGGLLLEDEGRIVRGDDGRVDDQQEDDPVPDRLERRVVEDRPLVYPWRLKLVLW